jgi:hypothetical protein
MKVHDHFAKSREHWQGLAAECEKAGLDGMAKVCSDRAAHYKTMQDDATNKSIVDELNKGRNELPPPPISRVTPDNPNLRAIPRFGAPPLQKAVVDEEFAHLISSGDDRTE